MAKQLMIHTDGALNQLVTWDDSDVNNNLLVVHEINLEADKDARLGGVKVFDKDKNETAFNEQCAFFNIQPQASTKVLIKYEYDEFAVERDFRTLKSFTENGSPYQPAGRPKVVAVVVYNTTNNSICKTAGEAI